MGSPSLPELPVPSRNGDERETLEQTLDYFRIVLSRKASALDHGQLMQTLPPSSLSLAGLLYHMAAVEEFWFTQVLLGRPEQEPWTSAPWDEDPDWEFTRPAALSVEQIWAQFDKSLAIARSGAAEVVSLDTLAAQQRPEGTDVNLRWIYVHMIEEYARHCGHADFLRQAIDGSVDD